ncbi:MAG: biosynthetic-type acetolactate synthase large subunit [Clostridiales bacterium]|nr:biosynthetic-type acetolactate synthase large subunit [Clostridiales bacterium]
MPELKGAQIVLEALLSQGVETVFGYPGGTVLELYDALYSYSDKIKHIITAGEQGAAFAADGYARASGKPGVVFATSGPGATNLVTGIACSYMDSVPVVAITGNVDLSDLGRDSFQEIDITGITMPITKYNFIVKDVSVLAQTVKEAFSIALSGRKGPVLIDIPKNIMAQLCDYSPQALQATVKAPALPSPEETAAAAKLIDSAQKPLLYIGGGAVSADASEALISFAEKLDIPVASSVMGLGAFPADNPLNLGFTGMHGSLRATRASEECDVLIAAGVRFSDRAAVDRKSFASHARVIHIDIDPAEMDKNIFSEIHLCGNLAEILPLLTHQCRQTRHEAWINALQRDNQAQAKPLTAGYVNPEVFLGLLGTLTKPDTIVATDVGQHQMWTAQYYKFRLPRTLLTSGGLGAMGYGMGAAIGARLAKPDSDVILITGDGSFLMNMNELATVSMLGMPLKIIIFNNNALGMVRQWQATEYSGRFSQTIPERKTDYEKIAEAFGADYIYIPDDSAAERLLPGFLSSDRAVIAECKISSDEPVLNTK